MVFVAWQPGDGSMLWKDPLHASLACLFVSSCLTFLIPGVASQKSNKLWLFVVLQLRQLMLTLTKEGVCFYPRSLVIIMKLTKIPGMSQFAGLKMALSDVKTWAFAFMYFCIAGAGGFQYFFPTLTATLGYDHMVSLLLVAPPYIFVVFYSLAHNWLTDRLGHRFWFFVYPIPITIIGFIIFMTLDSFGPRYFSFFLMNITFAQNGVLYAWVANSIPRPPAKRAAAYGIINMIANSASIWTPYTYYTQEAPYYRVALAICIVLQGLAGLTALFIYFRLRMLNKRQERLENENVELNERELRRLEMTAKVENIDIAAARQLQKGFRYML